MTIEEKYKRFEFLKTRLSTIGMEVLIDKNKEYLDLQREQMSSGYDNNGERIGVYANPAYERAEQIMNPKAGGYVDLKFGGDFQAELTLRAVSSKKFIEYSQDEKAVKLTKKYGNDIYFLNPTNLSTFRRNDFMPELKYRSEKIING